MAMEQMLMNDDMGVVETNEQTGVPKPHTEAHSKLLSLARRRLRSSEDVMSSRYEKWRRAERSYRLYVDPDEMQNKGETGGDPELLYPYPNSIVMPLSYALVQTLISFWVTLFTQNRPYFTIDPADQNSAGAAKAQELLITYQLEMNQWVPLLYQGLLDACRYGLGVYSLGWENRKRLQTVRRNMTLMGPGGLPVSIPIVNQQEVTEYEGNVPDVVDPFLFRPDPRWPIAKFQRGSFCAEEVWRSRYELLRRQEEGIYSNVEELPRYTEQHMKEDQSDRDRITQMNTRYGFSINDMDDSLILVEQLVLDIQPVKYDLSPSNRVERWLMTVGNRAVLLRVEPYAYDHQEFSYSIMESSPDLHASTNPGLLEIMEPVHQHITWFVNSMLENARKGLNDRIIVDPSIVNMNDVMNPSAGKIIRLNKEFWGIPGALEQGMKQLKVEDIASQNMQHVGFLIDLMQRVAAASETIQGNPTPEEKTATEISSMAQQGAGRLRTQAKLFSASGFGPMVRQMVQNNMQFMSQEMYLKIVGGLENSYQGIGRAVGGNGVMVSPEDIQGVFSFPISDASAPLDPVRFARTWVQIMQMSVQNPALAPQVNHVAVWGETLKAMGIADPSRFLMPQQVQVMPDMMLQQQVQQGNLRPMPQQVPGGAPPPRLPIPARPEGQSIGGEENRPR